MQAGMAYANLTAPKMSESAYLNLKNIGKGRDSAAPELGYSWFAVI